MYIVKLMHLNIRKNAVWALIEVIASGLTLFFMYKIVVYHLGARALGIWSLVLATTSIGRMADLGTASGLSRFLATAHAKNNEGKQVAYAETGVLTNLAMSVVIALILWLPAYYGLALAMPQEALTEGRNLLPYALISFVLMSVASATTGAVVGQHRSDQKSLITLAALIVQFAMVVALVPRYGLPAMALAQNTQYVFICAAGWLTFLHNHYGRWIFRFPMRWQRDVLKELLGFGVKMQAVSLASMFYEPLVKYVMSAMGGLDALGYYEMANKLVSQLRQMIVMPIQTFVPSFAHFSVSEPKRISQLYYKSLVFTISGGAPLLGGIILISPLISYLWIGRLEPILVFFLSILPLGWFFNLISAPAFIMCVGTGRLKGNFYGSFLTTVGSFLLALILGHLWQAKGVAIGANIMVGVGALLTMYMNCRALKIDCFPKKADFKNGFFDVFSRMLKVLPWKKRAKEDR